MSTRRTHTKSRTGCINCKRRKVKCDEAYPACFNCKRHNVPCSLAAGRSEASMAAATATASSSAASVVNFSNPPPPPTPSSSSSGLDRIPIIHGQPPAGGYIDPPTVAPTPSSSSSTSEAYSIHINLSTVHLLTGSDGLQIPPGDIWKRDQELMHHWCTSTSQTMAIRQDSRHLWQVVIPRIGYENPFILHGILALSASHKAYVVSGSRDIYQALSDFHFSAGSEGFRSRLTDVNTENWQPIFLFASLVVLYVTMLPARSPRGILPDPLENMLEVVTAVRSIRGILAPLLPLVARTELAPLANYVVPTGSEHLEDSIPYLESTDLPSDTAEALRKLRAFQAMEIPTTGDQHYLDALILLRDSARIIATSGAFPEMNPTMRWLYLFDDCIFLDMKARKPHALLLLAYYCVFISSLAKSFWMMRGWARPLVLQIESLLADQPRFLDHLRWPLQHV